MSSLESMASSTGSTSVTGSADLESTVSSSSSEAVPSATVTTLKSTTSSSFSETHTTWSDNHEDNQTFPPITTHWTVPENCTWTYNYDNSALSSQSTGLVAWLDLEPISGASTLSCYPDGMFYQGRTGVFSPATCPNGWTTASLCVNTNEVRDEATTTAICCSSEYRLDGDMCKRTVSSVLAVPISYNHTARTYRILSDSTTTLYSATVEVYTIRALFQDDDKKALGLQDWNDIDDEDGHKHLSLGAKVGIGIGTAVFVLLLIAAGSFFLLRREKARVKRKRALELDAMRNNDNDETASYATGEMHERRDRCFDPSEPAPAFERSSDAVSVAGDDVRLSGETATRADEIRALKGQKEAIERRIDELEQGESSQSQAHNQT